MNPLHPEASTNRTDALARAARKFMKTLNLLPLLLVGALALAPAVARADETAIPNLPQSAPLTDAQVQALGQGIVFPYDLLESTLGKCVTASGQVDYGRAKGDINLATFVRAVGLADLSQFPTFPVPADPAVPNSKPTIDRTAELAFWINAYNGLFLKAVCDAYPIDTIGDIKDHDSAQTRIVAGKSYSFAQLRAIIAAMDPRALFALSNGTKDGPAEQQFAFRFANLNTRLLASAAAYINNNAHVSQPDRDANTVHVSPWLATVDPYFKKPSRHDKWSGIRQVLMTYTAGGKTGTFRGDTAARNYFLTAEYEILFLPSNNALNSVTND